MARHHIHCHASHAGGIRQQFKAAQPLVEKILRSLKVREGLNGPLGAEIWDQGDAVGAWKGAAMSCVLFPTGRLCCDIGMLCAVISACSVL